MMDNETFKRIFNNAVESKDNIALHQIIKQRMQDLSQRINIENITEFDACALAMLHKNQYESLMCVINEKPKMKKMYGLICRTISAVSVVMPAEKKGE